MEMFPYPKKILVWKFYLPLFNVEMVVRSRLLQFVTGTSRVPMNGFKVEHVETSAPLGAWKCYVPALLEIMTDQPTKQPTNRPTSQQADGYDNIYLNVNL